MTNLKGLISGKIIYRAWTEVSYKVNYRSFIRERVRAIFYPIIDIICLPYDEIG